MPFPHQVMDAQGKIGGLLDIAKCLYDAVSRLEHAAKKKALEEGDGDGEVGSGSTVMIGAVMEAAKAMKGKASAKNQQALQVGVAETVEVFQSNESRVFRRLS